jgi:hypothetical protein
MFGGYTELREEILEVLEFGGGWGLRETVDEFAVEMLVEKFGDKGGFDFREDRLEELKCMIEVFLLTKFL